MVATSHVTTAELETGLDEIRRSPKEGGTLKLIVRRPQTGERQILEEGRLDLVDGLVGDNWRTRGSSRTVDGTSDPDLQLTVMNSRLIALVSRDRSRWQLAGDQLFVDLDLSIQNLPVGTQLSVGSAVIEVTEPPHTGCKKFVAWFGRDAMEFVNSLVGRQLRLRGMNARVVRSGVIRVGDVVRRHQ